jgi:hypothetical protein
VLVEQVGLVRHEAVPQVLDALETSPWRRGGPSLVTAVEQELGEFGAVVP